MERNFNITYLQELMKERNMTQQDLADVLTNNFGLETSLNAVKSWSRKGKVIEPTMEKAMAIIEYFDADAGTLIPFLNDVIHRDGFIQTDSTYIDIPVVYAGAGATGYTVEHPEHRAYPKELIPPQVALDENVLIIIIAGNSMEPLYYENDAVFIDMVNGREFFPINGTYLVRYGDSIQIKDVEFLGNGDIILSSRNSKAIIQPIKDLGLEWEIIGKPYVNIHATLGSKLKIK